MMTMTVLNSHAVLIGDYYILRYRSIHALVRIIGRKRGRIGWVFKILLKEPLWYSKTLTVSEGEEWGWFDPYNFIRKAYQSEIAAGKMRKTKKMLAEEERKKNPPALLTPKAKVKQKAVVKKRTTKGRPRKGPKSFELQSRVVFSGGYYRVLRRGSQNLTLQSITRPDDSPLTGVDPDQVLKAPEQSRTFRTGGSGNVVAFEEGDCIVVAFEEFPTEFIKYRKDHGNFDTILRGMTKCRRVEWVGTQEFLLHQSPPGSFDSLINELKLRYRWT